MKVIEIIRTVKVKKKDILLVLYFVGALFRDFGETIFPGVLFSRFKLANWFKRFKRSRLLFFKISRKTGARKMHIWKLICKCFYTGCIVSVHSSCQRFLNFSSDRFRTSNGCSCGSPLAILYMFLWHVN